MEWARTPGRKTRAVRLKLSLYCSLFKYTFPDFGREELIALDPSTSKYQKPSFSSRIKYNNRTKEKYCSLYNDGLQPCFYLLGTCFACHYNMLFYMLFFFQLFWCLLQLWVITPFTLFR